MDRYGNFYELTDKQKEKLADPEFPKPKEEVELLEDAARLEGYLKGRIEADLIKTRPNSDLTRRIQS